MILIKPEVMMDQHSKRDMRFKILKTDEDLISFSECTSKYIDVLLPFEYLIKSRVIACIDKNNRFIGGFVLVTKGPFRVIESIPKNQIRIENKLCLNKTCEITGLWLNLRMNRNRNSLKFWTRVLWELFKSGKRYFVYAYSLSKPDLGRLYSNADPDILFRGVTKLMKGMKGPENESVEVISLKKLVIFPFKRPMFFIKRLRGRRISDYAKLRQNRLAYHPNISTKIPENAS